MRFVLSDSTNINSYGFRTDLNGLNLDRFRANPVMLYSHDNEKVIGRWENIAIEDGKLTADAVFDTEDEESKKIAGKVERGFLKGCSIGICIYDMYEDENGILTASKSELMEASICAIPSDANATVLYDKNRKRLSADDVKQMCLSYKSINTNNMKDEKNLELEATIAEKDAKIAELQARVSELEAQVAESKKNEVESFLEAKIAEGKMTKEEKEGFAKLAVNDFETVKSLIESRKVNQQPTVSLAAQIARQPIQHKSWDEMDKEGTLLSFKNEHPEEYKELYAQKFGK